MVSAKICMHCGYCQAACKVEEISVSGILNNLELTSITEKTKWLAFGLTDTSGLVQLLCSHRSCRNFHEQSVPLPIKKLTS
jgi:ferredoxin